MLLIPMFQSLVTLSALTVIGATTSVESNAPSSHVQLIRTNMMSSIRNKSLSSRFSSLTDRKYGSSKTNMDKTLSRQLRSVRSDNDGNFVIAGMYTDSSCSVATQHIGMLLNHCFNEEHQYLNIKQSYMYSMINGNILELEYDGSDCKVIFFLGVSSTEFHNCNRET